MTSTACFMIVSRNDIPIYEAEVGTAPKVCHSRCIFMRFNYSKLLFGDGRTYYWYTSFILANSSITYYWYTILILANSSILDIEFSIADLSGYLNC